MVCLTLFIVVFIIAFSIVVLNEKRAEEDSRWYPRSFFYRESDVLIVTKGKYRVVSSDPDRKIWRREHSQDVLPENIAKRLQRFANSGR